MARVQVEVKRCGGMMLRPTFETVEEAARFVSCRSKRRYTRKEAKRQAKCDRSRHKDKGIEAYRCRYCGSWHVGGRRK